MESMKSTFRFAREVSFIPITIYKIKKSPSASIIESPPRSSELAARLKIVSLNDWAIWGHRVFSACLTLILLTHLLWACLLVGSSPKFMLQMCKSDLDLFNHGAARCEKLVDLKVLDKLEIIMAWKHADDMQKFVPAMAVIISAFVFFLTFQVVFWKSAREFHLINKWPGNEHQEGIHVTKSLYRMLLFIQLFGVVLAMLLCTIINLYLRDTVPQMREYKSCLEQIYAKYISLMNVDGS
ncbi:hypothetical protein M3Y94_01190000 [Aphelenchoides besseyi]|nr:hypothetical protein M3Y94_01190000 [Aphelenchoides besseyi]